MEEAFEPEELRVLHKACREGEDAIVAQAISSGLSIDMMSPITGRAAVHEACASGKIETLELLLRKGADLQRKTFLGADTPLHLAVKSSCYPIVSLLLEQGCDPNTSNHFGATPFHYISKPSIAKLMLRWNGNVCLRDKKGKTPVDIVCEDQPGCRELKELLKDARHAKRT